MMGSMHAYGERRATKLTGGRMAVLDQGQGLPILLGHGFLWDRDMWAPQVEVLSRHRRVIVPDMWGHGGSDPLPPNTHNLADLADQMVELLDQLGIARCVVAGSSMGGMWAAHLAARAPQRIAGLVILNSSLAAEPPAQRGAYAAMLDQVAADGFVSDGIADRIIPLFFAPEVESRTPELPHELRRRLARFTPEALRQSIVPLGRIIFDRPNALDILWEIEAPALIVTGKEDRARPPLESSAMAGLLNCKQIEITACGHTATLEQPGQVTTALLDFLERLNWLSRPDRDGAG